MPRFEPIADSSANPRVEELYRAIVDAGIGSETPISWFQVQSARPDILEATWKLVRGLCSKARFPPPSSI